MGQGMQRAFAAAKATQPMNEEQQKFLRELLRWEGAASPRDLGPQTSQAQNAARQTCKRRGWVTCDRHYWRITDAGRAALSSTQLKGR